MKCVNNATHSVLTSGSLHNISLFSLCSVILFVFFYYLNVILSRIIDNLISFHFNTYPSQRLHSVRLCWRSINQLSSIERFAWTIWMWRDCVFQQISLSSLCYVEAVVSAQISKYHAINTWAMLWNHFCVSLIDTSIPNKISIKWYIYIDGFCSSGIPISMQ